MLGEDDQVIEVNRAVEVEVALGPRLSAGRVVVLGELDQVVEVDGAVVVGVAGEVEEVGGEVVAARAVCVAVEGSLLGVGDGGGGEGSAIVAVGERGGKEPSGGLGGGIVGERDAGHVERLTGGQVQEREVAFDDRRADVFVELKRDGRRARVGEGVAGEDERGQAVGEAGRAVGEVGAPVGGVVAVLDGVDAGDGGALTVGERGPGGFIVVVDAIDGDVRRD